MEAVPADGGHNIRYPWMALDLLHFHRTHGVHFATQVRNLRLLKHLAGLEERVDFLEEYLAHGTEHHRPMVAGHMYTLDRLANVVLHSIIV